MAAKRKKPSVERRTVDVVDAELAKRIAERDEALAREAAIIAVLQIINSSPGDVAPVFDAILERATQLCKAVFGNLYIFNGSAFSPVAVHGSPDFAAWFTGRGAILPPRGAPLDLILRGEDVAHIVDATDTDAYRTHSRHREVIDRAGIRTWIGVALRGRNGLLGGIIVYRQEKRPFAEQQIALLQSFAQQAVIAIENARLFNETKEALERQTATAEVLRTIASSPGDSDQALRQIAETSARLFGAPSVTLFLAENGEWTKTYRFGPSSKRIGSALPLSASPVGGRNLPGRVVADGRQIHIPDLDNLPPEMADWPGLPHARAAGTRTACGTPLRREGKAIGALLIFRDRLAPFTADELALQQSFADQAVIAIENTRLLRELRDRTEDLSRSLDDLRAAQDRLVQAEKLASLGQLTAGIAHEIKNPLNFINNFSSLSGELIDELNEALAPASLDQKLRDDVGELTQLLKSNLEKVVQHGKRADSIVKNMLLHSREGSGEHRSADINALVEESLNLAYHSARAERSGFEITLRRDLAPDAGAAELYPQEITRSLLNLISNGFYAATERKAENDEMTYEPTLFASTRSLGSFVQIRIRDNGTGIPPEVKEKMFNPFFTTKPAGEGTGLGLSMTHDIIVKQHGGKIDVETEPGAFTEFIVTLPRSRQ